MPAARQIVQLSRALRRPSVEPRGRRFFGGDLSRTTGNPFISRTARIGQSRFHAAHNLCAFGNVCLSKQLGCIPLMEPTMISPRVLSTVPPIPLLLPMSVPPPTFPHNLPPLH